MVKKDLLNLNDVKVQIKSIKGKQINLFVNKGRKKIEEYIGCVEDVYPSVFTVKIENNQNLKKITCSYSKILCGDVKVVAK